MNGSMPISKEKVERHARPGHQACLGRGILGYRYGTTDVILCKCVYRSLRTAGVNTSIPGEAARALAPDRPREKEAAAMPKRDDPNIYPPEIVDPLLEKRKAVSMPRPDQAGQETSEYLSALAAEPDGE